MPTIDDWSVAACNERITRRGVLRVGGLTLSGLVLGDVLRLRAESPFRSQPRQKSVIMIHLSGGPSHLDMYDMKPAAPSGYRGEFKPIETDVLGMEICELMPLQAQFADKFAILRGVYSVSPHTANEFYSGYPWQESPRAPVPGEGLSDAHVPRETRRFKASPRGWSFVSTRRTVHLLTSSDRAHTTLVSIRSVLNRLEAPRVDTLVDCSDRRVCGCLDFSVGLVRRRGATGAGRADLDLHAHSRAHDLG
jgi:Protein of unknown function (DUF1501)